MSNNKPKDLEVIKSEVEETTSDYLEKSAKISDDKKSLLIRIPQEIRNKFDIKAGDKIKFSTRFEEGKSPELEIKLVKNENGQNK